MAFRGREYLVRSKQSVLIEINKDIKEYQKKMNIPIASSLIRKPGFIALKVSTRTQHADETFDDVIGKYRENHHVSIEVL